MLEKSKEQHGYTWMYVKELEKRLTELGKKDYRLTKKSLLLVKNAIPYEDDDML